MKALVSIAMKDLRLLARDKMGMIFILLFPLFLALFFGAVFGGGGSNKGALKIAVIDNDKSKASLTYLEKLKSIEMLKLLPMPLDQAKEKVRQSKLVAYLHIPKGFGKGGPFGGGSAKTNLQVGIDPARRASRGYLEGLLTQGYYQSLMKQFSDPQQMKKWVSQGRQDIAKDSKLPVAQKLLMQTFLGAVDVFMSSIDQKVYNSGGPWKMQILSIVPVTPKRKRPLSAFEVTFPSGLLWGLLSCALGFAISLVREQKIGTFLRLQMAPISRAQILLGKGLACFLAAIGVMVLILTVGVLFTKVRIGQPLFLVLAMLCNSVCFVGLMMIAATLGKTEEAVNGAGWAGMMVMAMLGGGMIPLISMPTWLAQLSNFSPVKWGILAIEGAIWRDFTFAEMLVPCGILVAVGVISFGVGWALFQRAEA